MTGEAKGKGKGRGPEKANEHSAYGGGEAMAQGKGGVAQSMATMTEKIDQLQVSVARLETALLYGNGHQGVLTRLSLVEEKLSRRWAALMAVVGVAASVATAILIQVFGRVL